ncbi:Zn-ribbon domain-containing OB-fold protein [Mycolicibacterium thermoresistibile]
MAAESVTERPDPRAQVQISDAGPVIVGVRCRACRYPAAGPAPRCPVCHSAVEDATFVAAGTVWSSTVVRVPVPGREPPVGLAYVDLDDGPRILVHLTGRANPVPVGSRVRVCGHTPSGDVQAEVMA